MFGPRIYKHGARNVRTICRHRYQIRVQSRDKSYVQADDYRDENSAEQQHLSGIRFPTFSREARFHSSSTELVADTAIASTLFRVHIFSLIFSRDQPTIVPRSYRTLFKNAFIFLSPKRNAAASMPRGCLRFPLWKVQSIQPLSEHVRRNRTAISRR